MKKPKFPDWKYRIRKGYHNEECLHYKRYIENKKGKKHYNREDDLIDSAEHIFLNEPPVKAVIESMALENCSNKIISNALFFKFNHRYSEDLISVYKEFFFDLDVLNTYELAQFYESNQRQLPNRPPVPGEFRESYVMYQNGITPELDNDKVLNAVLAKTFFRANELAEYGWVADDKYIKYTNSLLNIIKLQKENNGESFDASEFEYEVEYPESTSVEIDQITGYDPGENINE